MNKVRQPRTLLVRGRGICAKLFFSKKGSNDEGGPESGENWYKSSSEFNQRVHFQVGSNWSNKRSESVRPSEELQLVS